MGTEAEKSKSFFQLDTSADLGQCKCLNFFDALKSIIGDGKVSFELLEGAGHEGTQFTTAADMAKVIAFFDKYLN